jgi:hypothetical protein
VLQYEESALSEALPASLAPFVEPCAGPSLRSETASASRAAALVEALRRAKRTASAIPSEVADAQDSLERRIRAHLTHGRVQVTLTDNRYTMISVRRLAAREDRGGDEDPVSSAGGEAGKAPRGIHRSEIAGEDPASSAGGVGGKAPRGFNRSELGAGDPAGLAGGVGPRAHRGVERSEPGTAPAGSGAKIPRGVPRSEMGGGGPAGSAGGAGSEARGINRRYEVRLHHMFADADPVITRALAHYIADNDADASRILGDFIDANSGHVRGRSRRAPAQLILTAGEHHDLREIFDELNARYFDHRIDAAITWGPRSGRPRRRNSIKMGSYSVEDRLIRIHRSLDRAFVPRFFVAWIVFHEMLHQVHDIRVKNGRREFHSKEFLAAEASFELYEQARLWERRHLDALLTY